MALKVGELFAEFGGRDTGFSSMCDTVQSKFESVSKSLTSIGKSLTVGVTTPIIGIGTAAFKAGSDFESSMSQVAATMGMTADDVRNGSAEFTMLSDAAKKAGSTTAFSATQASEALNYLALAGYSATDSCEALPKVLNLAAAGNMDLGTTSDMVTDSMSALGLEMSDLDSFMDKMAKTSSKSNTSVEQLGNAILTVGGTAKMLSGGVTEMNTALGILADNGVKGSEGGTALRNVILSLTAPTDTASDMLNELGVAVADANGNMRPLNDILQDLDSSMTGLGDIAKADILNTIFNKVDLKSVNALLANSTDRWDELTDTINDSAGACQQMADTQLANLPGSLKLLKSSIEGAAIKIYDAMLPALESIIDKVQGVVDWFNSLSDEQVRQVVQWAALAAAIGPIVLVLGKVVSAVGGLVSTFGTIANVIANLKPMFTALGAAIGGISAPVLIVVAAIAALTAGFIYCWNTNEDFRTHVTACWESIKTSASQIFESIKQIAETIFTSLKQFWSVWGEDIKSILTGIMNILGSVFKTGLDYLTGLFKIFAALFKGDWQGAWDAVKELFATTWDNIKNTLSLVLDSIQTVVSTALEMLAVAIGTFVGNIIKVVTTFIKTTLPNTIKSGLQLVTSAAKALGDGAINAIKNLPSRACEIAKNFVSGLANGIKNGISSVVNAAKDLANKAVSAAKNALGIHSPSKVMIEVGEYTGEGFEVGLENTKSKLSKVAASLVNPEDFKIPKQVYDLQMPQRAMNSVSNTNTSSYNMTFNLTTDGETDLDSLATKLSRKIQQQINRTNRAGGVVY